MTRACLSLLAGMYAQQLSSFVLSFDSMNVVLVAAIVLLSLRQFRLFIWFGLGVVLFLHAATDVVDSRIPAAIAGDSIVVDFKIAGFTARQGMGISFVAHPIDDPRLPHRIRLSWFDPPVQVRNGDTWQFEVRLRRPRGNRNPGSFDYESWLFRQRIAADGYVVSGRRNHLLKSSSGAAIDRLRQRFVDRVVETIEDRDQASILVALAIGSRHLITNDQWDRYAATGTSHLMAISGLHIGLAAGIVYLVALYLSGIGRSKRNIHCAAILISIIAAVSYALLSGFAIPARRASLMLALAGIALLTRRKPDLLGILCSACTVIAMSDPLATMAPGFMLSFAAVAILIWAAQRRSNLLVLQSMLLFGLLPLTALLFDRVSIAALPVNLLAVPLFSFVTVPLTLLGMLLDGPLRIIGDPLLHFAASSIALLEYVLAEIAAFEWASFAVAAAAGVAYLYIVLPTIWVLLPPGWPGRRLAWVGLAAVMLYRPVAPRMGCAIVEVLDVGQGLAVVVRTQNHVLLYDSGPAFRGGGNAAENIVLPYLRSQGIDAVDHMVVSHADLDHAGGVGAIIAAVPVHQTYAGEPLASTRSVPCRAGQRWTYDGVDFQFLHPAADGAYEGNDGSCVLLLDSGGNRVLFSGDIEKNAENSLIRRRVLPPVDAVIVPHHGSRTSSTIAFVHALKPSVAVVSASFGNQWGFPKADIVARWEAVGAEVINTAAAGAIQLRICGDSGLESIRRYRADNRRIWHE
ncbi:MAG: DNA internalization-related competence protein ComEC/Rec2 [Woeseiaceae bacterium]